MRLALALRRGLGSRRRPLPSWQAGGQQTLRRLLGSKMRNFAEPPIGEEVHAYEFEFDDEGDEEDEERMARRKEEITNYVKAVLEPAWGHGRKRVYMLEPDALERVQSLTRLLSGRQAKQHAARVMNRPTGQPRTVGGTNAPRSRLQVEEEVDRDEEEDEDDEEEEEEEEDEEEKEGEERASARVEIPVIHSRTRARGRYSPGEALAYLSRTVMANYSITQRVLLEAFPSPGSQAPRSVLDFGSGPGTALLAAQTLWPDIERIEGIDRSEEMLDLSRLLLRHIEPSSRLVLHRQLPALAEQVSRTGAQYDLVMCTYTLTELDSEAAMAAAAQLLWGMVAPQGALVLIEAGNPIGSHVVRSVRKMLLSGSSPRGEAQAYTVGPCPHDHPCPLRSGEWCSFTQRVQSPALLSPGGKGRAKNFRDVSFSYVILRKDAAPVAKPESWSHYSALYALRHKTDEEVKLDWQALEDEPLMRGEWARLVRSPTKAKGRVTLDLCTPEGHIEQVTIARAGSKALPGKLLAARRADWGGLWPYPEI